MFRCTNIRIDVTNVFALLYSVLPEFSNELNNEISKYLQR